MNHTLTETQKNKIIEHSGNGFYLQVLQALEICSEKWKLSELSFNDDYSVGVIFFCKSELYGDCVLKIYDDDEIELEYNALCEYNGDSYVKAFEYEKSSDITWGAMLIERIYPGETLTDEPSLEKRLAVFSELFNGLYVEPKKPTIYESYTKWLVDTADYMVSEHKDNKELCVHALKAKEMYLEMEAVYDKKLLIHTDLHSDNIISCGDGNGKYKIIDFNKAVIGDPIFETGMFVWGECCYHSSELDADKAEKVLEYLEKSINISNRILRQCFYITAVIGQWDIGRIEFVESAVGKIVE